MASASDTDRVVVDLSWQLVLCDSFLWTVLLTLGMEWHCRHLRGSLLTAVYSTTVCVSVPTLGRLSVHVGQMTRMFIAHWVDAVQLNTSSSCIHSIRFATEWYLSEEIFIQIFYVCVLSFLGGNMPSRDFDMKLWLCLCILSCWRLRNAVDPMLSEILDQPPVHMCADSAAVLRLFVTRTLVVWGDCGTQSSVVDWV